MQDGLPSPVRSVVSSSSDPVATQRQSSTHRSRGKGVKRTIINSRSLVQAITQQQKGSQHTKKVSSRKY